MAASENKGGSEEMDTDAPVTHTKEHFSEEKEVVSIITSIEPICDQEILLEAAAERLLVILDQYQEQPHLLDPHLENLMSKLLANVMNPAHPPRMIHQAFKYIYYFSKVRGPKYIVRLFTHEVSDIEPLLSMLKRQDLRDCQTWETRYVLLLWLSIACMIPFDMSRLDGTFGAESGEKRQPVVDRIMETAKVYLCVSDKSRDAAALLLAKFVTRPDVKKKKLAEFIDWCLCQVNDSSGSTMLGTLTLTGILTTLALMFKHGKRDDLNPYAPAVLDQISKCKISQINNTVLRKLNIKLIQRIGLTFLKPRIASWRYQRGSRSLAINLDRQNDGDQIKSNVNLQEDMEEEYDIPEELEDIIEQLLLGLKDKDTVVRWSAAKGVGRITGSLPKDLADEVVAGVLELFRFTETDGSWHGGCLALAELGRRGLLLPQRLPEVVPLVLKALSYDDRRGSYSVGSHVRDGACYVCWSFARAYDPKEITPHVHQLASALIIAALFDREVNCRRAASASFQENVGRQGTFPHGIDILTAADYHAVANRTNTYLNLSVFVAKFGVYTIPMIDHLVNQKLQHWDGNIRKLAAKALHNLTSFAVDYMTETVLPKVLSMTNSIDLFTRHGSILACAEIVHALYLHGKTNEKSLQDYVSNSSMEELKNIVPKLHSAKQFRGMGGEFMRHGVAHLIKKISISSISWHGDPVIDIWQEVLDDSLSHTEPDVQVSAVDGLRAMFAEYYKDQNDYPVKQDKLLDVYLSQLESQSQFTRTGFSMAFGILPNFLLKGRLMKVIEGLCKASQVGNDPGIFAEARREALISLGSMACTVGIDKDGDCNDIINGSTLGQVYEAFLDAMNDYTTDSRGDVGAWAREASMTGLEKLTLLVLKTDRTLLEPEIIEKVVQNLIQQASEKIDRTRAHAGTILSTLVGHKDPIIPHIPHLETLLEHRFSDVNFGVPSECFPFVTKLLSLENYRYHALLGLTVSVGGLTESLVRHSSACLLTYLKTITSNESEINTFANTILKIHENHAKNDRVIIPLFKMLDLLLSNNCFELFMADESHAFPLRLVALTKEEIRRIKDPVKIMASVNVFCQLLQFAGKTRIQSLQHLNILLCHQFPRIRKTTADQMYTALLMFDDVVPEEKLDDVMAILSETMWDLDINNAREERNKICELLGIPKPVLKAKTSQKPEKVHDALGSYKDLLCRSDY